MRLAIIDLGTNSVRFDVHQIGPGRQVKRLHREKIMVRLGTGIFMNGRLDRHAIHRTLHAFKRFKRLSEQFRVRKTIAFGTSALREAVDREKFLKAIEEETGIHLRVISGTEEAKLIAHGILKGESRKHRFERIKGCFALVDIGGGSTEVSICRGKEILYSQSFPLGTSRLQQLFLKKTPPDPASVAEVRKQIRNVIFEVILPNHWPSVERVFGSSGTVRAIEKILNAKEQCDFEGSMSRKDISALIEQVSRMNTAELLSVPGLESKRMDMIVSGGLILDECMLALGAKKATFTEFSLRDGVLEEELYLYQQGSNDSHLSLHYEELYEKAKLFGADEFHLKRTVQVAETLFDRLARIHQLKPSWKVYLTAAMILRDIGESIHVNRHPEHSYYIVKNSDLPAVEEWELELIARLCLHHEGSKLSEADLAFTKNKTKREAFCKLLALLRIADALDLGPECELTLKKIQLKQKLVSIRYSGKGITGLETMNIEKKAEFFKSVFKRWIEASWT